jgi:hypothetical protein
MTTPEDAAPPQPDLVPMPEPVFPDEYPYVEIKPDPRLTQLIERDDRPSGYRTTEQANPRGGHEE